MYVLPQSSMVITENPTPIFRPTVISSICIGPTATLYAIIGSTNSITESTTTPPLVPGSRNTGRESFVVVVVSSDDDIFSVVVLKNDLGIGFVMCRLLSSCLLFFDRVVTTAVFIEGEDANDGRVAMMKEEEGLKAIEARGRLPIWNTDTARNSLGRMEDTMVSALCCCFRFLKSRQFSKILNRCLE